MKRASIDGFEDLYEECHMDEDGCKEINSPSQSGLEPDRRRRRGLIEKKRRDRINYSLMELKRLVPAAFEKQSSTKLEKAEILKMTVDYLKVMHNTNKSYDSNASDYKQQGFDDCADEVLRYLVACEGMDSQDPLCLRLISHLKHCSSQRRKKSSKNVSQEKLQNFSQASLNYWNQKSIIGKCQFSYNKTIPNHSLVSTYMQNNSTFEKSESKFLTNNNFSSLNVDKKACEKQMSTFELISNDVHNGSINQANINQDNNNGRNEDDILQALHNAHENLHRPILNILAENSNNKKNLTYNNSNSNLNLNNFHNANLPIHNNQNYFLNNNYNSYHFFPPPPPPPSSSSSLFNYLKPYRPWGSELTLY